MGQGLDGVERPSAEFAVKTRESTFFKRLKVALDEFAAGADAEAGMNGRIDLTRASALGLLRCLHDNLRIELVQPAGDDDTILIDHPAMALLQDLADAVEDLNNAKTHDCLKPAKKSRGNSLARRTERERIELAILLEICSKDHSSLLAAAGAIVKRGRAAGKLRNLSANQLVNVRKVALRTGRVRF
jgi:hypothetical protein